MPSEFLGRLSNHAPIPTTSPETTGMRILRLEARPQSSTENAGVPMAVVQRSQLDTPSVSPQPQAMSKKKANRKATTPANTESQRREVALIAHSMDGRGALGVPLCSGCGCEVSRAYSGPEDAKLPDQVTVGSFRWVI